MSNACRASLLQRPTSSPRGAATVNEEGRGHPGRATPTHDGAAGEGGLSSSISSSTQPRSIGEWRPRSHAVCTSLLLRHHCGSVHAGVGPSGRVMSASVARSRSAGLAGSGTTALTRYPQTHGATGVRISTPTKSYPGEAFVLGISRPVPSPVRTQSKPMPCASHLLLSVCCVYVQVVRRVVGRATRCPCPWASSRPSITAVGYGLSPTPPAPV